MEHARRCIYNVPQELWKRLRVLSVNRNWTVSRVVIEAIKDYLDREGEPDEQDRLLAFNQRHV